MNAKSGILLFRENGRTAADETAGEVVMRTYQEDRKTVKTVLCNGCGRELRVEKGILREGCFAADYPFGYFSSRDGQRVSFDLCEECFSSMLARFRVPAEVTEQNEFL
ncbi:MAG: hypothetical protein Q4C65_07625 [Eubacteriales bacterium]|nr:hypothetical protein [Eubacteriales bacterium]